MFRPYQHYVMGRKDPNHAVTPDWFVCLRDMEYTLFLSVGTTTPTF